MNKDWLQEHYEHTPSAVTIFIPAELNKFTEDTITVTRDFSQIHSDKYWMVKRHSNDVELYSPEVNIDALINALVYVVNVVMMELRNHMNYQKDAVLLITSERQHWNMCFWCRAYEVT